MVPIVPETGNFRNDIPEISVLRKKNRSGIPVFRNLFHNGNGKNCRIISVRKPYPGIPVETRDTIVDKIRNTHLNRSFNTCDFNITLYLKTQPFKENVDLISDTCVPSNHKIFQIKSCFKNSQKKFFIFCHCEYKNIILFLF